MRVQSRRQAFDRGRLEELRHRHVDVQVLAQPGHQPHRQQRMASEREEVILQADLLGGQREQVGISGHEGAFDVGTRRDVGRCRAAVEIGDRQCLAVDLAVGAEGQGGQGHERRGHHVARQVLRDVPAQRLERVGVRRDLRGGGVDRIRRRDGATEQVVQQHMAVVQRKHRAQPIFLLQAAHLAQADLQGRRLGFQQLRDEAGLDQAEVAGTTAVHRFDGAHLRHQEDGEGGVAEGGAVDLTVEAFVHGVAGRDRYQAMGFRVVVVRPARHAFDPIGLDAQVDLHRIQTAGRAVAVRQLAVLLDGAQASGEFAEAAERDHAGQVAAAAAAAALGGAFVGRLGRLGQRRAAVAGDIAQAVVRQLEFEALERIAHGDAGVECDFGRRTLHRRGSAWHVVPHHIAHQLAMLAVGPHRGHGGSTHPGVPGQHGLDFAQLDAVAFDLDLEVLAAEELDVAVGQQAAEVAGAVQALAGDGVLDEVRGRLLGVAPVALRQADAADVELAGHPQRSGLEVRIEHVEGLVAQRLAVGHAAPVRLDLLDGIVDGPDGGLGGAAQALEVRLGGDGAQPLRQAQGDPVAREHHQPQGIGQGLADVLDQHAQQRGHGVPHAHAFFVQPGEPLGGVALDAVWGHDDLAADGEGAEEVVDREVEAQGGEGEDGVVLGDAVTRVDVEEGVDGTAVVDHHALGQAGRPRGEDHVRQVLRLLSRLEGRGGRRARRHRVQRDRGRTVGPRHLRQEPRLREDQVGVCGVEDVVQPLRRHARIQRQVGRAGVHRAQRAGRLLPALVHDQRHQAARARAQRPQPLAELARPRVQLAIGLAAGGRGHRHTLRCCTRLPVEELVQQGGRRRGLGGVRLGDHLAVRRGQQVERSA